MFLIYVKNPAIFTRQCVLSLNSYKIKGVFNTMSKKIYGFNAITILTTSSIVDA